MVFKPLAILALVPYLVSVQAQSWWLENQVNTTLCYWAQLRAAIIRDTIYLDGGDTYWIPGFADGSLGAQEPDLNPYGRVFTLNLSRPFNKEDNITAKFGIISKAPSDGGVNNLDPNYIDGALLANDAQWFSYGGLIMKTDAFDTEPPRDQVLGYRKYQYGLQKEMFAGGFVRASLKTSATNVTRYIAYGAAASAPSENKAWYFSGLQSPLKGPIYGTLVGDNDTEATEVAKTLIALDMAEQQNESWKNDTLPSTIPGRAGAELVWVPVGSKGILVALGGVLYPEWDNFLRASRNNTGSRENSPEFMSTIDIYDVASGQWYRQPTVDGPGQLSRGCAVVAPAQDSSSFNIYYYGGQPGLISSEDFSDDVWVLSLPSFTWIKVLSGNTRLGRAGHKCFMPYPDQMLVIGGEKGIVEGAPPQCLDEPIRVLNLTSGAWLNAYDPAKYDLYSVPESVQKKIGGSATGGATTRSPSGGWAASELGKIFDTPYTTKIAKYWPYAPEAAVNNTNPGAPPSDTDEKKGGGVPSWLPPVLGVVLGLMLLTIIAVLILLWRRRRLLRAGTSVAETEDTNGYRIMSWMRGQQQHTTEKAPTVTTSDEISTIPNSPSPMRDIDSTGSPMPPPSIAEAMDTQITPPPAPVELMDTSPRAELHDTGLSHIDVLNRHSSVGRNNGAGNGSLSNPSYCTGGTHQIDHASNFSSSTGVASSLPPHMQGVDGAPPNNFRPDSELMGSVPPGTPSANRDMPSPMVSPTTIATRGFALSDVSNVSERDKAHLRQISDATVSSMTSGQQTYNSNGQYTPNLTSSHRFSNNGPAPTSVPEEELPGADDNSVNRPDHIPIPQSATSAMGGTLPLGSPQPVSPPTAGMAEGGDDYMSVRPQPPPTAGLGLGAAGGAGATSSPRRSMFTESKEDMNGTEGK